MFDEKSAKKGRITAIVVGVCVVFFTVAAILVGTSEDERPKTSAVDAGSAIAKEPLQILVPPPQPVYVPPPTVVVGDPVEPASLVAPSSVPASKPSSPASAPDPDKSKATTTPRTKSDAPPGKSKLPKSLSQQPNPYGDHTPAPTPSPSTTSKHGF